MSKNLYVDIHALQIMPPNNVNRDDVGSPKTTVYGGATRARVSSQCWKRAVREKFRENMSEEKIGVRTLRAADLISEKVVALSKLDNSEPVSKEEADKLARKTLENTGVKLKSSKKPAKKKGKAAELSEKEIKEDETVNEAKETEALLFLSHKQAEKLAELALAGEGKKDAYKQALQENPSIDIALFGRMVAGQEDLKQDAACQVAHAISTHRIETEYDFFTAVDDRKQDESGAGHLGSREFSSSVLYRYATVNVRELEKSLGDETVQTVMDFIKTFLYSRPKGMQNSFAGNSVPTEIYISIREDMPLSLAGAFEKPVKQRGEGFEEASAQEMVKYAQNQLYETLGLTPKKDVSIGQYLQGLGENQSFSKAMEAVEEALKESLTAVKS